MPKGRNQTELPAGETAEPLTISSEKVCFIIVKALENSTLKMRLPIRIPRQIQRMTGRQQSLRTMKTIPSSRRSPLSSIPCRKMSRSISWPCSGDYAASDWPAVREEAARAHNENTASYLLGTPLLGDFLEEGLSMLGHSCEEFEIGRF